jgi:cation diffusion facilitator CzcD-associated flavoprotein CzcO
VKFPYDVVIVGAGISGLAAAAKISQSTRCTYVILEKGNELGGTWRDNTYPGCACDIPAPLYSFSFLQNPEWRQLFATQPEILDYLHDASRRLGICEHIRLHTTVSSADWDATADRWQVTTLDGRRYSSRYLVNAVGILHHPLTPQLAGMDRFDGPVFHSSQWDHTVELAGKKVAVVGTGASAIQFVPAIVDTVAELTVFQRTPPWIVPKRNRQFSAADRARVRRNPLARWRRRARLFWAHEKRVKGFLGDQASMLPTHQLAVGHLERQVPDAALRASLTPEYAIGCKRLLISSDYYPALCQPQVHVVTDPIREVAQHAVVTMTGKVIDADVIIYGTGFDAQHAITHFPIRGRDGVLLENAWSAGPQAYLGTLVNGFPNLFLMCGPNTALGHNSQVFMIEAQANYTARCIRSAHGNSTVEVGRRAQDRYNDRLQRRLTATVWQAGGCTSWYQDAKTGRNTLLWPKSVLSFWLRTRRVRRADVRFSAPDQGAGTLPPLPVAGAPQHHGDLA